MKNTVTWMSCQNWFYEREKEWKNKENNANYFLEVYWNNKSQVEKCKYYTKQ